MRQAKVRVRRRSGSPSNAIRSSASSVVSSPPRRSLTKGNAGIAQRPLIVGKVGASTHENEDIRPAGRTSRVIVELPAVAATHARSRWRAPALRDSVCPVSRSARGNRQHIAQQARVPAPSVAGSGASSGSSTKAPRPTEAGDCVLCGLEQRIAARHGPVEHLDHRVGALRRVTLVRKWSRRSRGAAGRSAASNTRGSARRKR